jgi:hypothetical protein
LSGSGCKKRSFLSFKSAVLIGTVRH